MENQEIQVGQELPVVKTQRNKFTVAMILLLVLLIVLTLIGWENDDNMTDILGSGSKSISLSVKLPSETVNYKINTNANVLDDVLMEHNLANLTHLGMGSVLNSISGYTLRENIDWYDVYVNGNIVYTQTSNIAITNGHDYTIVIFENL